MTAASAWQSLRLRVYGTDIEASLNGKVVVKIQDDSFDNGPAALGSGYHYAKFASFSMNPLNDNDNGSSSVASSVLVPVGSIAIGYPVFTGTSLSVKGDKNTTGQFGFAFTPTKDLSITALSRFAAAGPVGQHLLSVHCAAYNHTQKDPRCHSPPVGSGSAVWHGLGTAMVDFRQPDRDATGMVWAPISTSNSVKHGDHGDALSVVAGQQYYLVSEEGSDQSPDDLFYTTAKNYPCIGAPGPGGTLPKLDVSHEGVVIDGGVYRLSVNGSTACGDFECPHEAWQPLLWDYRPRSFGPLSFAVAQ